jgi:hypothetical protein
MSPAIRAGIEIRLLAMEDVVALIDEYAERNALNLPIGWSDKDRPR